MVVVSRSERKSISQSRPNIRCPTNPGFTLDIRAGQFACISFQVPRVPHCQEVFIHIRIITCVEAQTEV
ncbi:unnamed protein product [Clavelina lepadiformis]|uniref:Uncharacterized protein n=1 Tax=Clavelina lepadiformis TaxID=159417 RepID=A0ABP0GRL8_CLALP